ncbi:MAG: DUF6390 family protein [Chloroflexota bacterium]
MAQGTAPAATDEALAASGALTFARFAAPPNVLGYCGGSDHHALVGHLQAGLDGPELVALCRAFEGAWPYLGLIARSSGIEDPLDRRVVNAYWLGNGLLDRVPAAAFRRDLDDRFRPRTPRREWQWLATKPADGAVPHHSFHVLEVMPRIGMLRAGQIPGILPAMEQCLIRPGRVVATTSEGLVVAARPLVIHDGRLAFGPPIEQRVLDGPDGALPGDRVAIHWGWSCGRLSSGQAGRLDAVTRDAMDRANRTI